MNSVIEGGLFVLGGGLTTSFIAGLWQFRTASKTVNVSEGGTNLRFFVERFEKEIARLDGELGEARKEIKDAETERTGLFNQIAVLQQSVRENDQEKGTLKTETAELLAQKQEEAHRLEGKIARLQHRVHELENIQKDSASKNEWLPPAPSQSPELPAEEA